jgi:D-sedoheptulose 7-phosphate isomerase
MPCAATTASFKGFNPGTVEPATTIFLMEPAIRCLEAQQTITGCLAATRTSQALAVLTAINADNSRDGPLATSTDAASAISAAFRDGHRAYFAGNGGSAAQSSHIASELVGRFKMDRPGLPAFALTDSAVVTSTANDYGCEELFARQAEAMCRPGDVFVAITTSGTSPNILAGLKAAKRAGATTIAFCGLNGELVDADIRIRVPSRDVPRIQEAHMLLAHIICEMVETDMFGDKEHEQRSEQSED